MDTEKIKKNLLDRGYAVTCFATAGECAEYLNRSIDGTTVGIGGSVTVAQMNLLPMLEQHNTVYWHNDPKQVSEFGAMAVRKNAIHTDIYISSVNAMSEDGAIINIDYTGNRISTTAFGHSKVYLIVGKNKIEPDFEKALWRARNIAAPKNAQRVKSKTPCAVKGDRCYDCNSPERICRGFLVLERAMAGMETEIVLVEEELGY